MLTTPRFFLRVLYVPYSTVLYQRADYTSVLHSTSIVQYSASTVVSSSGLARRNPLLRRILSAELINGRICDSQIASDQHALRKD